MSDGQTTAKTDKRIKLVKNMYLHAVISKAAGPLFTKYYFNRTQEQVEFVDYLLWGQEVLHGAFASTDSAPKHWPKQSFSQVKSVFYVILIDDDVNFS